MSGAWIGGRGGAGLAALVLASCGYIGEPLPPSPNIPARVEDLSARQIGSRIVVEFTLPAVTTDGLAIRRFRDVELRTGPPPQDGFNLDTWPAEARRLEVPQSTPGLVRIEIPAGGWIGREVFIAVRAAARDERYGDWSKVATLQVTEPLDPPAGLRAEAVPQGVRLFWQAPQRPGLAFRVYRRAPKQKQPEVVANVEASEWIDTGTQYGQAYEYAVQALVDAGQMKAESAPSAPASITSVDTFPPNVPAGLSATPGTDSIELVWDRNTEADLAGYRVYRAAGSANPQRLVELVETPSYSDRSVERGRPYRYAVSAVDQLGNESAKSAPVEAALP